ncbi:hypothetical protein EMGBD3_17650 [Nitrosarchaeum sp.]|nr:hypothetical protein EMGBD3_17650 [Nitrosarchaeum sp.]
MNDTIMTLYSLEQEVGHVAKNSHDQGREYLNDLEIKYLLKMTKHVVMKIMNQVMERIE